MKKALLALCSLLIFVSISFAAKPPSFGTSAMLKGTYAFQGFNTKLNSWSSSRKCNTNTIINMTFDGTNNIWVWVSTTTQWQTFSAGGSDLSQEFEFGTMVFDGAGGLSGSGTAHHSFDQTSSNNTTRITCGSYPSPAPIPANCFSNQCNYPWGQASTNSGHSVFLPDSTISFGTGTSSYTVTSTGTGMLGLDVGGGTISHMYMSIGGPPAVVSGPWTTILFFEWGDEVPGNEQCNDCGIGTAVLQQ
jgi:hypothetical protein